MVSVEILMSVIFVLISWGTFVTLALFNVKADLRLILYRLDNLDKHRSLENE